MLMQEVSSRASSATLRHSVAQPGKPTVDVLDRLDGSQVAKVGELLAKPKRGERRQTRFLAQAPVKQAAAQEIR